MTPRTPLRLITLACLATLGATTAQAQSSEAYSYIGLGGGQSRSNIDAGRITGNLAPAGSVLNSTERQDIDISYKVFGGYQFNRWAALEAGFFSLGEFGFGTTTTSPGGVAGTLQGHRKVQGLNLDLVGSFPLSERFTALARVGAQYARIRGEYNGAGANALVHTTPSERSTNAKIGAGLQYMVSPAFLVRAEVERYRVSDAMGSRDNINVGTVSLVFPFGRAPGTAPRASAAPYVPMAAAAPAPAPMAPAVAATPAPMVVVIATPAAAPAPVVAPERRRVSFSADSLFSFDQSALREDSKPALDALAKELATTQFDTISVEGHTDRLGSNSYNDKLSLQRAEAVKAYLVSVDGLQSAKINAVGKGETSPVTKLETCKGNQATAKLITCLQPDRRVDVEVVGTR